MYSVRMYTRRHGTTCLHVAILAIIITALLTFLYGINYLVVFSSSFLWLFLIEFGLAKGGVRKGTMHVNGKKLPLSLNLILRCIADGPTACVPAFFVAEQFMDGNILLGIAGSVVTVALVSTYMGWSDRRDLRNLEPGEEPITTRRDMTKPMAVMVLAAVNTICLTALLLIPTPYRSHALTYLVSYSVLVMLFYFINYNFGVRLIQLYDHKNEAYTKPKPLFQAIALGYDSSYEMALLMSPAYWIVFYIGLFHYTV